MESTEELQRKLKRLSIKNRQQLESISTFIMDHDITPQPQMNNYHQLKQQYEILLNASKQSIERNTQLQQQLQNKQHQAKTLKIKLHRQNKQLDGLVTQMTKASGHLKRQRKSRNQLLRVEYDNTTLKKQIENLQNKKTDLQKQSQVLIKKQEQLRSDILKIEGQISQMTQKFDSEGKQISQKIQELQEEIEKKKYELEEMRAVNSSRVATPDRSMQKRKNFAQIQLMIRQHKQKDLS